MKELLEEIIEDIESTRGASRVEMIVYLVELERKYQKKLADLVQ